MTLVSKTLSRVAVMGGDEGVELIIRYDDVSLDVFGLNVNGIEAAGIRYSLEVLNADRTRVLMSTRNLAGVDLNVLSRTAGLKMRVDAGGWGSVVVPDFVCRFRTNTGTVRDAR